MTRGSRFGSIAAFVVSALIAWMAASAALAQDTTRVVVQSFRGPSGNVARAQVLGALKNQSEVEVVKVIRAAHRTHAPTLDRRLY